MPNFFKCAGNTSFDSIREKKSTLITTAATGPIIVPKRPSISVRGRNATIVVNTPNVTGTATSMVPLIDASIPESPFLSR